MFAGGPATEKLWTAILQVALSAAAIIGILVGTGELFFGSIWLGVLLLAVGVLILYYIVKGLNKIRVLTD